MPTETAGKRETVLYVFAHQDDEYGINSRIRFDAARGKRVVCAYLTDGGANVAPQTREAESLAVLQSYGVCRNDVAFIGARLGIGDGELHRHALSALEELRSLVLPMKNDLDAVYTLAWEGGHQDHDAAHAIAASLLGELDMLALGRQFGLYDGAGMRHFFRVMRPPRGNRVFERRISAAEALRSAVQCWRYPSQRRTWLGLFPEAALRWIAVRREVLADIDLRRLRCRPHDGALLYERLFGVSYDEVAVSLAPLRERGARIPGT